MKYGLELLKERIGDIEDMIEANKNRYKGIEIPENVVQRIAVFENRIEQLNRALNIIEAELKKQ